MNIAMSATRMAMYLQCKWKYWSNYILHKPRLPNIAFKLGIAAHETLKVAGKIWQKKEKFTAYDIKKIKEIYTKVAAREGIQNLGIYDEGLSMVLRKLKDFEVGKIIGVEDKFEAATGDGVIIIGAMDKIVELNDETVLVVDYKTSKTAYTSQEMKEDIQLSIYDVAASIKFPAYKRIILCLDYLKLGTSLYTYRTYKERKNFSRYLLAVYNELLQLREEDAVPTLNDFCNWCDFKDDCPAYVEASKRNKVFKKKLENCSENELVTEYLDARNRKRVLDNYEKKLKAFIIEKIGSDEKDLIGQSNMIYIRQNSSTIYDPKTVYNAVPLEEFLKMVSVSKKLADEYLEDDQGTKVKIIETARKGYTSPFLSSRKIMK